MSENSLSRRAFLTAGGALAVSIALPGCGRAQTQATSTANRFNDRIEIHADGTVHVLIGRIEMGQGLNSAIAQLAAEELDVEMSRIVIPPVDTAFAPNEGFTDSSASMRGTGMSVRQAAAEARTMLLAMAARRMGTSASVLSVQDGNIHGGTENLTYWQIIASGEMSIPAIGSVTLKQPTGYRLLGTATPRTDLPAKVTGGAAFVQDLRLPDMLHARVVRPPSYSASLTALGAEGVSSLPGVVQVVRNGSFLAVMAEREEQAIRAAEHLRAAAEWRESETLPGDDTLFSYLRREAGLREQPDSRSGRRLASTYEVPYRMHGSIGPSCAVAQFADERLTVWSHAQGMYPLRSSLSGLVGLPQNRIRCIHMEGAGCYGHNGADDAAADAALIAMAVPGRPIRLQWMREDEHLWLPYGPAMVVQMSGALDANGRIAEWSSRIASPPHSSRPGGAARLLAARHIDPPIAPSFLDGFTQWAGGGSYNADPYYDIPARVDARFVRRGPLRSSALRSLGAFANVVAIEGFMDELAEMTGKDPVAFRLDHLTDARARAVIETTAERFGWAGFVSPGRGKGFGFARLNNYGAYVALAAEALAGESGAIHITRIVATVDCGELINPDGVRNQIEGGIVQAASWTLMEAVAFDRMRVRSADWDNYPILRITEAPEIDVHLINRNGDNYLGVGEAAQGPAGAAVANAVANLIGRRLRKLPLVQPDG